MFTFCDFIHRFASKCNAFPPVDYYAIYEDCAYIRFSVGILSDSFLLQLNTLCSSYRLSFKVCSGENLSIKVYRI